MHSCLLLAHRQFIEATFLLCLQVARLEQRIFAISAENDSIAASLDDARKAAAGAAAAATAALDTLPSKPREAWPRAVQLLVSEAERRVTEELAARATEDAEMLEASLNKDLDAARRALAAVERTRAAAETRARNLEARVQELEAEVAAGEVKWRRQVAEAEEKVVKAQAAAAEQVATFREKVEAAEAQGGEAVEEWKSKALRLQVREWNY